MRHLRLAALLGLGIAALAGTTACTAAPAAPAAPSASSNPTASTTSTPDIEPAASIVVSPEAITVIGDEGSALATFDYHQPTSEVVSGLSEYLGEPTDSRIEQGSETPPATLHEWDGLQLLDTDIVEEAPYWPNHVVRLTGAEAGDLPVTTSAGISVGDALDSIDLSGATTPVDYIVQETGRMQRMVRVDLVALPPAEGTGASPDIGVLVTGYLDDAVVDYVEAPSSNYGH
jgi:hypothetical protein